MSFTIETFRSMLRVRKHDLDAELEIQSETQERISSHKARLNTRMLELKKALDSKEAEVIAQLKMDDPKLSNPLAEKEAKRDRGYLLAWREYQDARQEHEEWDGLYESWKSRGYQLKTLADLYHDQYFTIDSTSARPSRDAEDSSRARMREASTRAAESRDTPTLPVRRRTT